MNDNYTAYVTEVTTAIFNFEAMKACLTCGFRLLAKSHYNDYKAAVKKALSIKPV